MGYDKNCVNRGWIYAIDETRCGVVLGAIEDVGFVFAARLAFKDNRYVVATTSLYNLSNQSLGCKLFKVCEQDLEQVDSLLEKNRLTSTEVKLTFYQCHCCGLETLNSRFEGDQCAVCGWSDEDPRDDGTAQYLRDVPETGIHQVDYFISNICVTIAGKTFDNYSILSAHPNPTAPSMTNRTTLEKAREHYKKYGAIDKRLASYLISEQQFKDAVRTGKILDPHYVDRINNVLVS